MQQIYRGNSDSFWQLGIQLPTADINSVRHVKLKDGVCCSYPDPCSATGIFPLLQYSIYQWKTLDPSSNDSEGHSLRLFILIKTAPWCKKKFTTSLPLGTSSKFLFASLSNLCQRKAAARAVCDVANCVPILPKTIGGSAEALKGSHRMGDGRI
jgi:hypothetical protein